MANRNFPASRMYNFHVMPVLVDMQVAIGASGAPTLSGAPGVSSVTKLATGTYQIQLKDNYNTLLGMDSSVISPVTGSAIDPNAGAVGSLYQISTVGNTDWATAGLPSSVTAAVGAVIVLAAAPSAGTGRVKLISPSNVMSVEIGGPMMNSNNPSAGSAFAGTNGAIIIVRTMAASITAGAYTPAGTISAPVLTMNSYTPTGTNSAPALTMDSYTPAGTNANDGPPETFTGTPATLTGSVAAPVFTGAAATLTGTNSAPTFTGAAASLTATMAMIAANATDGSTISIRLYLNNSSVQ